MGFCLFVWRVCGLVARLALHTHLRSRSGSAESVLNREKLGKNWAKIRPEWAEGPGLPLVPLPRRAGALGTRDALLLHPGAGTLSGGWCSEQSAPRGACRYNCCSWLVTCSQPHLKTPLQ